MKKLIVDGWDWFKNWVSQWHVSSRMEELMIHLQSFLSYVQKVGKGIFHKFRTRPFSPWFKSWKQYQKDRIIYKLGGKPIDEVEKVLYEIRKEIRDRVKNENEKYIASCQPILDRLGSFYAEESFQDHTIRFYHDVDGRYLQLFNSPQEIDQLSEIVTRSLQANFKQVGMAGLLHGKNKKQIRW